MVDYFRRSVRGDFDRACAAAAFIAIACYNSVELVALCFITFRRYSGMYFWCLLIASFSVTPFALGYLLIKFEIYGQYFPIVMISVGWWGMVTGQSLVLWSRLHLLVDNRFVMRGTLGMIIINAIILHIPGTVLEFGDFGTKGGAFSRGFGIFERIQLIIFSVQEVILSSIYLWEAIKLLKLRPRGHYRRTLAQLVAINLAMILMDAAIIAIQYSDLFVMHVTIKAMVYSVKLKFEYAILGKIVESTSAPPMDQPDFIDPMGLGPQTVEERQPNRERQTSVTGEVSDRISEFEMERRTGDRGTASTQQRKPDQRCRGSIRACFRI